MNKKQQTRLLTESEALKDRKWFLLDAEGKTVGRFSSEVAKILRGKHKVTYTPYIDAGDGVIIINAEKVKVTGAKKAQKKYRYYTQSMGGLREVPFSVMQDRKPEYILMHAIAGMMPKTRLGKQQLKKLRIYAGTNHKMEAQNPISLKFLAG